MDQKSKDDVFIDQTIFKSLFFFILCNTSLLVQIFVVNHTVDIESSFES